MSLANEGMADLWRDGDPGAPARSVATALMESGAISPAQFALARRVGRRDGVRPETALIQSGFLTEMQMARLVESDLGLRWLPPTEVSIDPELAAAVPRTLMTRGCMGPVSLGDGTLTVVVVDPSDTMSVEMLASHLAASRIEIAVSTEAAVLGALAQALRRGDRLGQALRDLDASVPGSLAPVVSFTDEHPVVHAVTNVVLTAARAGATDIHFDRRGGSVDVRYRRDGQLTHFCVIADEHWSAVSHRLKIMGGLDIGNQILPQDGRFSMAIDGRNIDFRVSSMPAVAGESIVVRILDELRVKDLNSVGLFPEDQRCLMEMASVPEGLLLITGPTGSGKTTTLYSLLLDLCERAANIISFEEPVEVALPRVRQVNITRLGTGESADIVRFLLRQDPDIVAVGEVRDGVSAQVVLRACLAGRQVLTTLHCSSTATTLQRLMHLGVDPRFIGGNIAGIMAQRLIPQLCVHCRVPDPSAEAREMLAAHGLPDDAVYTSRGCAVCDFRGFDGRVPVAELLPFNEELNDAALQDPRPAVFRQALRDQGRDTLWVNGLRRLARGEVSLARLRAVIAQPQ